MNLTKNDLMALSNIVGQVSVPIASEEALQLKELINKMAMMINEMGRISPIVEGIKKAKEVEEKK